MDQVFKPFVDRFSQPIILSFIVAWIFWNWKIPLGLIWYDKESISLLGYTSYEDLIAKNSNIVYNFIGPVITAFLYPLVILIANNFTALIRKLDIKLLHLISKGSIVPWELYHNVLKISDEREKSISRFVAQETELTSKLSSEVTLNEELDEKLRLLSEENNNNILLIQTAKDRISELNNVNNKHINFSRPDWLGDVNFVEIWDDNPNLTIKSLYSSKVLFYFIKDGSYLEIHNNAGVVTFEIKKYYFDIIKEKCLIQIEKTSEDSYNDKPSNSEDIFVHVFFRDLKINTLEFTVNTTINTIRTKVKVDKHTYVIEIK